MTRSRPIKIRIRANPTPPANAIVIWHLPPSYSARRALEEPVRQTEHGRRQADARVLELGHELRAHAGRLDPADHLAAFEGFLLEGEHVLQGNHVAFHALHFGYRRDLA